jgi:hypothetical protein
MRQNQSYPKTSQVLCFWYLAWLSNFASNRLQSSFAALLAPRRLVGLRGSASGSLPSVTEGMVHTIQLVRSEQAPSKYHNAASLLSLHMTNSRRDACLVIIMTMKTEVQPL